tara:strand:- start:438 stop:1556 length:1119 start_codon:yes stop_codon:yes gene_type:complete
MPLSKIQDIGNQIIPNLGRRNFIINGALSVDQRHNFGTFTTETYLGDRLNVEGLSGGGGATMQVVSDAPDVFPNGKSGKVTVTGTDGSLATSDFYTLRHIIEGNHSARLGFGTSNAKTCTLSFYVKSSLTGTFCVAVGNGANNRGRPFEYTINSANTWERKTIEVAGDTSGTYLTTNGRGIIIRWCMGVGSDRQASAGSYSAQEVHGTSNQTNLFATNSATFQITGLQFEEGSVATDFEHESFDETLIKCQRYYQLVGRDFSDTSPTTAFGWGYTSSGSATKGMLQFERRMRIKPTFTQSTDQNLDFKTNAGPGAVHSSNAFTSVVTSETSAEFTQQNHASNFGGAGQPYYLKWNGVQGTGLAASVQLDAEL